MHVMGKIQVCGARACVRTENVLEAQPVSPQSELPEEPSRLMGHGHRSNLAIAITSSALCQ